MPHLTARTRAPRTARRAVVAVALALLAGALVGATPAAALAAPTATRTTAQATARTAAPATAPAVRTSAVRTPTVPAGLPAGIEALAPYVAQASCEWTDKPGAIALGDLLRATYPGTSYGVARPCTGRMTSEHYDGRAVDWMNSVRKPAQAAQAQALLDWLFAPDRAGRQYANARRLGVMYIIWNDRIWGSYAPTWRPYQDCAARPEPKDDTTCHRDHMHISLTWEGAMKRTSFWTKRVAAVDYGPCRPKDLNWAAPYTRINPTRCPSYPAVTAGAGASDAYAGLVKFSGAVLRPGYSGAPVTALQTALGVERAGEFGPKTTAAVRAFQTAHRLPATAVVDAATWRALLVAFRPGAPTAPTDPGAPGAPGATALVDASPVALAVAPWGPTETVYARRGDGRIWYREVSAVTAPTVPGAQGVPTGAVTGAGTGWRALGGAVGSGPDAAATGEARHVLVARSTSGSLLWRVRDGVNTGIWGDLGGVLTSAPAVAVDTDGVLLAVGRGPDGTARVRVGSGSSWAPWQSLGGGFRSALDVVASEDGFVLIGLGTNGVLYRRLVTTTGGPAVAVTGWVSTGRAATSAAAVAFGPDGAELMFARVADGSLRGWPAGTGYGGRLTSAPAVAVRTDRLYRPVMVGRGSDNAVWLTDGTGFWRSLGGTVT